MSTPENDEKHVGAPATPLRRLGRALGDLVFPPVCLNCGGLCEASPLRHVCARCAPAIVRVEAPHCTTCGHPFYGEVHGERLCPHCEGLHPAFREGRTFTLFKGAARALVIELKYGSNRERIITDLKRVSKPGRRIYAGKDRLPRVLGGMGTAILSTSRGVVTSRKAQELGIGGEVICFVW